jgi:hypothetical protein
MNKPKTSTTHCKQAAFANRAVAVAAMADVFNHIRDRC